VANEDDVARTYREVLAKFGDLDILVNNAGFGVFKNLVDFDRASFDAVFADERYGRDADGPRSREAFSSPASAETSSTSRRLRGCAEGRRARRITRVSSRCVA
jgi:NAD(P)-dependent dehydrogenase (short-subunit alcohol dehydrogenase family)